MITIDICPACLTELPEDYAFDHVAIDRVLAGDRDLFAAMDAGDRQAVVLDGLRRGWAVNRISGLLDWPLTHLQSLLPDDHPHARPSQQAAVREQIRELYDRDLSDAAIAIRIGQHQSVVARIRGQVLGLPSKYGPGGRRRKVVTA